MTSERRGGTQLSGMDTSALRRAEDGLMAASDGFAAGAVDAPPAPDNEAGVLVATLMAVACETADVLALECDVIAAATRMARLTMTITDSSEALGFMRLGADD